MSFVNLPSGVDAPVVRSAEHRQLRRVAHTGVDQTKRRRQRSHTELILLRIGERLEHSREVIGVARLGGSDRVEAGAIVEPGVLERRAYERDAI